MGLRAMATPPKPRPMLERAVPEDDDDDEARGMPAATDRLRAILLALESIELVIAARAASRSATCRIVSTGDDTHRTIDVPPDDALSDATEFLRE